MPPWATPVVAAPKTPGVIRITINHKKLNKFSILGQTSIPRADDVLDKLGTSRIIYS